MSSASDNSEWTDELAQEQKHVSMLYDRLDGVRAQAGTRLARFLRQTGGTPQARSERDSAITMYTDQLAQISAVENGLCFGRLDFHDDERRYVGRIGLFDDAGDFRPLLIDWRAPAARPFYLATAASPDGVARRRQIRTKGRTVVDLNDEVLDLDAARSSGREELTGEAALLAALTASRTGRMRDIVETIQAEQDRVIRADLSGVLVVQGGPGTGKTAVALHRAAYLLYTHRAQLSTQVVLIVGPNATFLRYISQVLPSLAETGVLLCTLGELYPGVSAHRPEPPEAAEVKGRLAMLDALAAAIRDRQRVPDEPLEIVVDGESLWLDPQDCRQARDRARRSGKPHNLARPIFETEIVHALARQVAERIGADPLGGDNLLDEADLAETRRELRREPEVLGTVDWLWPILTPQKLLAGLYASADRIESAAPGLADAERRLLHRGHPTGWTPADVPLLDEAAELLGELIDEEERIERERIQRERRARIAFAEGALEILAGSRSIDVEDEIDPEILMAADVLDAGALGERHEEGEQLTAAQRAAADRKWTFGHVIVDEAQELSPMAWRLLMRRCPSRSMTLVGDVAQTGDLSGTSSWQEVLEPYVGERWRLAELMVNYRTPAEIMSVAAGVLAGIDPELEPPRSVRETGIAPWARQVEPARLAEHVVEAVRAETSEVGDGRLGVLVPAGEVDDLGRVIAEAVPEAAIGEQPELDRRVVVLTVRQAKGLEFDSVLVVDPQRIVAESPRGLSDLYVALTRATRRLGVLHTDELPAVLAKGLDG